VETVLGLLKEQAHRIPDTPSVYSRSPTGTWNSISWRNLWSNITQLAECLRQRGLASGDRLAIIAPNSLEWELAHLAGLLSGATVIGLDGHDTAQRLQKILQNAAVNVLFVKDNSILEKLGKWAESAKLIVLISGKPESTDHNTITWEELRNGIKSLVSAEFILPGEHHPATIIYTSGTTGEPKGILYTHGQILLACRAITAAFPTPASGARFVCWLPLSNLFQRIMNQCALMTGSSLYMVGNPLKVLDFIGEIQPDVLIGVPRFFEKIANGIKGKLAQQKGVKGAVARYAVRIAIRYTAIKRGGEKPSFALNLNFRLANWLVLKRLRGLFGDRLQYLISGSAAMAPWVLEYFQSLGWLVLEAYGLSENIIPMAMNTPLSYRIGTVGRVLPENEIRLDGDGEIMVRGPGLFSGYYGDSASCAGLSTGGFHRTGDFGSFDADGFLRLTGRKSEIIKTSAGRRIALQPIESALREIPWVDHAVVFGSGRKCLTVLVTFDPTILSGDASGSNAIHDQLRDDLLDQIGRLARYERPAAVLLSPRLLTVAGGDLTPNLKVRRIEIERKSQAAIEGLYVRLDAMDNESMADQLLIQYYE
jgi:long-chain acyl-CoA synthetase